MIRIVKHNKNSKKPIQLIDNACCSGLKNSLLEELSTDNIENDLIFFVNIEAYWPKERFLSKLNKTHKIIFYTVHKIDVDKIANNLIRLSKKISYKNIFVITGYESQKIELIHKLQEEQLDIAVTSNMLWLMWAGTRAEMYKIKLHDAPNKKFSIFSRRYEYWRKDIFLDLLTKSILDNCHYTFSNQHPDFSGAKTIEEMTSNLPEYLRPHEDKVIKWLEKVPYSIKYEDPINDIIYDLLVDSYINVVLETHIENNSSGVELTEKIFKPIVCKRPFIVYGPKNILSLLQKQGFKTFGNIINETYDSIHDSNLRRLAIIEELDRINRLSDTDFAHLINECKNICDYNYQVYLQYKSRPTPSSFLELNIFGNK